MPTWRGIDYQHHTPIDGEPGWVGSFANDASRVETLVQVKYPTLVSDAVLAFTGYPELRGSTGFRWIHRETPHPLLEFPGVGLRPWLWCVSVARAEGRGIKPDVPQAPLSGPKYDTYILRLIHTSLTYKIREDDDTLMRYTPDPVTPPGEAVEPNPLVGLPDEACLQRYVTRWPKGFNRMISVPRALVKFILEPGDLTAGKDKTNTDTGPVLFEGFGKPEPGEVLHYTHHMVPREGVPRSKFRAAYGCVNRYVFDGYDPGTLLYEPPDVVPIVSANGQELADVHHSMRFLGKVGLDGKFKGWEWVYRYIQRVAGTGNEGTEIDPILDYRRLTTDGHADSSIPEGKRIFRSYNFADLFRPV